MESAEISHDPIKPSRKKPIFPVNEQLRSYLLNHGREVKLPVSYRDLLRMSYSVPLIGKDGKDTYWESASYDTKEYEYLREALVQTYAILKTEGNMSFKKHLDVARIDYCTFGNSHPFRIKIYNTFNGNADHYYIKQADASRIYGLELEHILSPNRIIFFTDRQTLVEEHIPGIPGDIFIKKYLNDPSTNKIRFSKEFVKFNERCFVRLLGDMRAYNFVVEIAPDIEDNNYRIRAIDFDQQTYEGKKNLYLPQFFKENLPFVELATQCLNRESIEQYQVEERTMMAYRLVSYRYRMMDLLTIMGRDKISTDMKIEQLKTELGEHFQTNAFKACHSMGQIMKIHLKQTLQKNLLMLSKSIRRSAQ